MKIQINEICNFLKSQKIEFNYMGQKELFLTQIASIDDLKPNAISWIKKIDRYCLSDVDSKLNCLLVVDKAPIQPKKNELNLIVVKKPKMVFFEILNEYFVDNHKSVGIAKSAIVYTKNIGKNVFIGHNCYICADATIGDNVVINNNVVIECPTIIGNDCTIGSGTVIGNAGHGYYTHNKRLKKVPDFGGVIIGNRVQIGSATCIARGTLSNTVIMDDTKIDNLCHIAHNVQIGKNCNIIALSMLAGSCIIGDNTYIAPGVLVMNQLSVGENSLLGMGSVVTKDIEANKVVVGVPAKIIRDNDNNDL